jgi:quercetin dioxygenase-like cupin family protein
MSGTIEIVEESKDVRFCNCDGTYYIELDEGAVASDHIHDYQETIYLIRGKVEYTVGDEAQIIESPAKITVPAKMYHKFIALTDCVAIEMTAKD